MINRRPTPLPLIHLPAAQRGVVLFVALIALVAMTLAGVALVRSVDTTTLAAGNMAFRKSATVAADTGIEAAITYLNGLSAYGLNANNLAQNYYSTFSSRPGANAAQSVPGTFATDIQGRPTTWNASFAPIFIGEAAFAGTAPAIALANGNTAVYAIQRLCVDNINTAADDRASKCVTDPPPILHSGSGQGILTYPDIYYRVTIMVQGPRNTVSYVQAMLSK